MIGALDFGSVYQNTVISPEDGLAPSWGDVVIEGARWVGQKAHNYYERTLQTLPRLKKTLPRWIDSQKRQYPIADERRFLYNGPSPDWANSISFCLTAAISPTSRSLNLSV